MAWKGVHISRPARLSSRDAQLVVNQEDGEVTMPIEDVAWIVLDSPQVTISAALIAACMAAGVAVIFTDERHTPSGMALPFHRHHRQAAVAAMQIGLSQPLRKRLWQALVIAKIENQAACLERAGRQADSLLAMAKQVASGDPDNVEARAAREYWQLLFTGFTRSDEADLRNKMLNYGYAVLRAAIARAIVANGLLPCFGLFHRSATNAFNLADDLLEPFRPFVDRGVNDLAEGAEPAAPLTLDHRRALAGILNGDVRLQGQTVSVLIATDIASQCLVRAMEASSPALLCLPKL
ncbi:type II CRISPR-associated endonuclease Cas1 [Aestuariivirga sp.]|uniref:type II CRISPR-associated endonuclease Cas1 n=1 Tax=Aestuariivirga sp. TaxID=2650926 RepID=UPI0025C5B616|nr:type II CRISPR-associated endonuclease Cas1 [Aestuariivirga sp.]MCA3556534.1 type II CRISPR-associated endonuclease Cas1 [Aestuariivirga sp.]